MCLEALLNSELSTQNSKKTGPREIGGHSELRVVVGALNVCKEPSFVGYNSKDTNLPPFILEKSALF